MTKEKYNVEELLKKADLPNRQAEAWHPFYRGKIEIVSKVKIDNFDDFAVWYTPGVARPCRIIEEEIKVTKKFRPFAAYNLTNKWNNVAVVSDGSRVLGLGDIGPEAAMPVMEGKALLFKYLGGVDAFPVCLDCHNADEIITAVKWLQPTFGGINLEDISQPKCFKVLDTLRRSKDVRIPVWHDDQQGTATIIIAAMFNALKYVNKKLDETLFSMVGAGAANMATARVMEAAGIPKKNIIMMDSKGILHPGRRDIERKKHKFKLKWDMCINSNGEERDGDIPTGMKDTDIVIAASKPGPRTIEPKWIQTMTNDPIVFACANPIPEIWPWEAKESGAIIVATGRSDFPNQVNNSLGFPGIFRGTLDVMGITITDGMCIAAAEELAKTAEKKELSADYIIPSMDEWEVFPREAVAVGQQAIKEGGARLKLTRQEAFERAETLIRRARKQTHSLMDLGFILKPPQVS
ncbi:MAG: NADP-dependent malic enzyme [Candidatus Heimdallarchaeota archaeon]|nr:MAG: NADP-dependent malic enzyme [Candidatus Heimdallarchaeota archaeon]